MASREGDMKGYYRQKKSSTAGISKQKKNKNPVSSRSRKKSSTGNLGSDVALSLVNVSHGCLDLQEQNDEAKEQILREFDMNMAYGPCIGMTRIARWERANHLGLNPPEEVDTLLRSGKTDMIQCVWDGRV